ncbi:MAG: hypothetical protein VX225_03990, partial [Pseudomonadota bacterium]|nr:hypothetical protein [Pseudomonadota bacterium]
PIKQVNQFKCTSEIKRKIPKGSVVNSFLFFGGGLELKLAQSDRFVIAHTNRYVVYEFWHCAMQDPQRIVEMSKALFPIDDPNTFHILQESWPKYHDPFARSALFFLLNRCSESGWISAGKLNKKHFNPLALSHLSRFNPKNFFILWDKEEELVDNIKDIKESEYLLFPIGDFSYNFFEYGKNKGYEMSTVHHKNLRETLKTLDNKWALIYNYHPQVLRLYKDFNVTMINKRGRVTGWKQDCQEVIVANF